MSKYDQFSYGTTTAIDSILTENENLIWKSKPKKSAFIINNILPMLPIVLFWLVIDLFFIITLVSTNAISPLFYIPFFAIHLFPVWIWLYNFLTSNKRWENTEYAVTDKRLIIQSGFIGINYISIYYKDISDVRLKIDLVDRILKVGDIYFDTNNSNYTRDSNTRRTQQVFLDIENPHELYKKLQKVVLDIQTDIEFPNDLRPKTNSGYNTEYTNKF